MKAKRLPTTQKSTKTTMNKKLRNIIAIVIVAAGFNSVSAQMKNVKSAQFAIEGEKGNSAQDILEGKGYIDAAYADVKTSNNNKMWLYRAMVYSRVFNNRANELLKNESAKSGYISGYSMMQYFKSPEKKLADDEEVAAMECVVSFGVIFNESGDLWSQTKYDELIDYYKIILFLYDKMAILDTASTNALQGQKIDRKSIITTLAAVAGLSKNTTLKKEVYLSLIDEGTKLPVVYEGLSRMYMEAGDTVEAEKIVRKGLAAKPGDNGMFQILVNFYVATNRVQLLMADVNKQIETNPDSRLHYTRGYLYDQQEKMDLAIADYRKAIELDDLNYDACFNLGLAIMKHETKGIYDQLAKSSTSAVKKKELKVQLNQTFGEARKYLEIASSNLNYSVEDQMNIYKALKQCAEEQEDEAGIKEYKAKIDVLRDLKP